ncbi:hypothetical protein FQR65_LT20452 [Abscondita terminalis]|nr:hypothetical protein FQR65_LT20452 [Abscondita terminalis]
MAYFLFFSTLALVVGMVVAHVVQPGAGMNINPADLDQSAVQGYVAKSHELTLTGFAMDIIPKTLPLRLVGLGASPSPSASSAWAPWSTWPGWVGSFYVTSLLFVVVVLGFVARLCGFSVLKLARYLKAELLLVLCTSSSESALPSLMQKMERAGCGKSVVGLVVPTGYSFNLDGTNIYMTLAALFIAQATNTHLTLGHEIALLLVAMLSSKGAAGVTGAGFITLAATLAVVPEVPVAGMALILGVDRFMSECRSLTNFMGNAVATVVVSRWENELDYGQASTPP